MDSFGKQPSRRNSHTLQMACPGFSTAGALLWQQAADADTFCVPVVLLVFAWLWLLTTGRVADDPGVQP